MAAKNELVPPSSASADCNEGPCHVSATSSDVNVVARLPKAKEQYRFPFKLYDMLEYASDTEYCSSVSWVKDGRAFIIHNKDAFLEYVVPKFFNQTKFRSFTRQLNLWGFTRLGMKGAWQHEHFIRGNIERIYSIQRVEIKNDKPRAQTQTEHHQPKKRKSKSKQRRSILRISKSQNDIDSRAASPAESTNGSVSSVSDADTVSPQSSPISNRDVKPRVQFEGFLERHHRFNQDQVSSASSACFTEGSQMRVQISRRLVISPVRTSYNQCSTNEMSQHQPTPPPDEMNMATTVHNQRSMQPPMRGVMNEDDLNFLLPRIFDLEDIPQSDNPPPALSINEASDDTIDPIAF
eukprot:CAMPEP_0183705522 /NCGR_PEP_ID=MMETSP0737-20130205/2572_1 /TAXON_ID=385413 /ORGANISM="Thalassiosira miniscula, Strain CCMP1093" /LENGTH=349 /DNA_ID=CAMNT_0025932671 /DNA_START=23 /DNA_END=1072 /DNA_ORIENTATION=+